MAKFLAVASLLTGLVFGLRGLYVWTDCGYDCPALFFPGLTATGAVFASLSLVAIGSGTFFATWLGGASKSG